MTNLQMIFFKVIVDDRMDSVFSDEKSADERAKKIKGEVQRVQSIKIAKIFDLWS